MASLFKTFDKELVVDSVVVIGTIPAWLSGVLVRTGPAKFEIAPGHKLRHWFDGHALLYRFAFHQGRVSFSCKFLQSEAYKRSVATKRIAISDFGTFRDSDPCDSLFQRVKSKFSLASLTFTDSGNVNVMKVGEKVFAMTETPYVTEFDPNSLDTKGGFTIPQGIPGQTNSAHPQTSRDGATNYNFKTEFGYHSFYHVYSFPAHTFPPVYTIICDIPVKEPGYMHSFSITQKYIILAEFPIVANPISFLTAAPTSRPFIKNFYWNHKGMTKFYVVSKEEKKLIGTFKAAPCFSFHHINAFDVAPAKIIIDMACYKDSSIIDELFLDVLEDPAKYQVKPDTEVRRYTIDLDAPRRDVTYDVIHSGHFEIPRINYERSSQLPYRFAYGLGRDDKNNFFDVIKKLDVESRTCITWSEEGCAPSEPVFIKNPQQQGMKEEEEEDDGLVLSVVICPSKNLSFLLILDAKNLKEVARASVGEQLPVMLHGNFYKNDHDH